MIGPLNKPLTSGASELLRPGILLGLRGTILEAISAAEFIVGRIYAAGLRKTRSPAEVETLEAKVRNSFQRLDGAEELIRRNLSAELFDGVDPTDRDRLGVMFSKRHTLTHNLGLVDQKYRDQVKAWEKPGQEVPLDAKEILWAADSVERMVCELVGRLGS